jgi:hypothetical protein
MSEGEKSGRRPSDAAAGICGTVMVLVNGALAWTQFRDHFSWGAMSIAFMISPLVNCTLLFASLLFTPADRESRPFYLSVAIVLPLILVCCQIILLVMN